MVDWPERLKRLIQQKVYMAEGGYEFNGKEISKLDPEELKKIADELIADMKTSNLPCINLVLSGIFAPMISTHELEAETIFRQKFEAAKVKYTITLSHKLC